MTFSVERMTNVPRDAAIDHVVDHIPQVRDDLRADRDPRLGTDHLVDRTRDHFRVHAHVHHLVPGDHDILTDQAAASHLGDQADRIDQAEMNNDAAHRAGALRGKEGAQALRANAAKEFVTHFSAADATIDIASLHTSLPLK